MTEQQTLPHSISDERAVLGGIILDNQHIHDAAASLSCGDFYLEGHREIFAAMLELSDEGRAIDYLTVQETLRRRTKLSVAGGGEYVVGLTDLLPRRPALDSYVSVVRDHARRRMLIHGLNASLGRAFDMTVKTREVANSIEEALLQIDADTQKTKAEAVRDFSLAVMDDLVRLSKSKGELIGLPTGIVALDRALTGFRDGEFTIIGGWAGTGKSSLALQAASACASRKIPVLFFSLEMSKQECLRRIWSAQSKVYYFRLHDPTELDEGHWNRLRTTMADVAEWPLYIDESPSLATREISARAKLYIRRHGVKLVIVDYMQIVDAEGRDERAKMTKVSKTLRQLAKTERVPVIGLSQLTRPKDQNLNQRPNKFHLKESGSLEADAHNILMPYRPIDGNKFSRQDEIIIAKQRNGPVGGVDVEYFGETLTYGERV